LEVFSITCQFLDNKGRGENFYLGCFDNQKSKTNSMPWVDGKLLSGNEMCFEESLSQEFDEEQWLEKAKIRF
jgi:hypothetical protein